MPEYFQVWVEFETEPMSEEQFLGMLSSFGSDWYAYPDLENEKWAIWNKNNNDFLLSKKVGWACVTEVTNSTFAIERRNAFHE